MSNPRIEVDVVANVAGVASGVKTATSQLDQLGNAAQSTAPKFEQLGKATSRYNAIGIDFARVIQDAPFGIIGVGNNITQLAQSFSGLGKAGDSLSSRLQLAFGQIFSSGNLLVLAVSAITTVWTLYEQGAFKSEEATKSLREKLDEFKESLDGVKKATLEGQIAAQKEISNYKLLQIQAENTNISIEKRLEAVNELRKQYPDYLKNLSDEQILAGKVGEAYNKLTNDILALAKAKAFSAQIDKNTSDSLTLLLQEEERGIQILQKRAELQALVAQKGRGEQGGQFVSGQDVGLAGQIRDIISEIDSLTKETITSSKERVRLAEQNFKLEAQIVGFSSQGANFAKQTGKEIDANTDKLKKYSQGWDEYNLQQESANFLANKYSVTQKDLEKNIRGVLTAIPKEPVRIISDDEALQAYNDELLKTQKAAYQVSLELMRGSDSAFKFSDNLDKISGKNVKIKLDVEGFGDEQVGPTPFQNFLDSVALQLDRLPELEQRVADFAKTINELIATNVTDAFIDLGYTIGETLASGGNVLKAIGGSLLKSFARFLGQFGEQLIAYGVAAGAFGKLSVALATPGAAIIAAPLAIAAGVALTAIAGVIGGLGKKGMGGGGGGGGGGSAGAGGGSQFTGLGAQGGLFAQNRDLNGELVVRGQDLVYVFGQANNRINKG
jgi:hypothetical protein